MDRFYWEKTITSQGFHPLVGMDEAGRGPLAGPVVAAAVQFPAKWFGKGYLIACILWMIPKN